MGGATPTELVRLVAELAEALARLTGDGDARRLATRARTLAGRRHPEDPAAAAITEPTVIVDVDVPALVVAETLVNERTGAVVVATSDGPVGIVAERDLVAAMAAGAPLEDLTATDLVSPALVTAGPQHSIAEAAALMAEHRVRHIPLVEGRRIVGVISALDLARALAHPEGSGG